MRNGQFGVSRRDRLLLTVNNKNPPQKTHEKHTLQGLDSFSVTNLKTCSSFSPELRPASSGQLAQGAPRACWLVECRSCNGCRDP